MTRDQLRSGQLVTTFGPGAMIDFPRESLIVAGLDHWHYRDISAATVAEPRLLEKLRRMLDQPDLTLRRPPVSSDDPREVEPCVTGWRFPEWFIVQRSEPGRAGSRRRRLVHLNSLQNGRYKDRDKKGADVVPVRWVRACPKGHVGDIDWKAVVHGQGSTCGGDLWVEERGTSGDLADITITCDCGQERRMSQAAQMKLRVLGNCNGSRPWLGRGTKEKCGQPNRLLIRSASNAYVYHRGRDVFIGSFTTPHEAAEARDQRRQEIRAGRPIVRRSATAATVTAFAEHVYFPETLPLVKDSTARTTRSRYRQHVLPAFQDVALRDVTYDRVCAFRAELMAKDVSGQTRREALLILRSILEEAARRGLLPANPAALVQLPPKGARPISVPSYADALKVVALIAHPCRPVGLPRRVRRRAPRRR